MNELTPKIKKITRDWAALAGEPVEVRELGGKLYGLCTELGARRLAHAYRSFDIGFSKNLDTWYFGFEEKTQ